MKQVLRRNEVDALWHTHDENGDDGPALRGGGPAGAWTTAGAREALRLSLTLSGTRGFSN